MTTKTAAATGTSDEDAKYREMIKDCVRDMKEALKEIRREKAKADRLAESSRRTMKDTWETLRRVKATL